jgi:DNA-binding PucR family transcriptional regulator
LDGQPSSAFLALVAASVGRLREDVPALLSDLHAAVVASAPAGLADDPALAAEIQRSNVAILAAWLEGVARDPTAVVEPVLDAETLDIVRDVARRGLQDATYDYFRVGLGVAAQHVMTAAFATSSDAPLLRDALALLLASASGYTDRSVGALRAVVDDERRVLASRTRPRRLEVATAVLDGEAIDTATASARLGFELRRPLRACVLWATPGVGPGQDELADVARRVAETFGARPPLVIGATAASVWAWLPTADPPDRAALLRVVGGRPGVGLAVGSVGSGVAGFRSGHADAVRTQRTMYRAAAASPVAVHDAVRVVELAGGDGPAAGAFVASVLGDLAEAPPALRATLRAVVAGGHDTAGVAERLGVHRNTVLARLRRARAALPPGSEDRWVDVGLALELDHWLGDGQE